MNDGYTICVGIVLLSTFSVLCLFVMFIVCCSCFVSCCAQPTACIDSRRSGRKGVVRSECNGERMCPIRHICKCSAVSVLYTKCSAVSVLYSKCSA